MSDNYDFSGWATRNNMLCADGRTIRKDAFKDNDGTVVPLVYNHDHDDPLNVLGHALLENRNEGVYCYCYLNDTPTAKAVRSQVRHGDITALSIYANHLSQHGGDVLHGAIREVSLVLAGANPGARIEEVMMHGEFSDSEAVIFNDDKIEIPSEEEPIQHAEETAKQAKTEENDMANQTNTADDDRTVQDVINTMDDDQKKVMYALIGEALKSGEEAAEEEMSHSDEDDYTYYDDVEYELDDDEEYDDEEYDDEDTEGEEFYEEDESMKHNIFDTDYEDSANYLSHADQEMIIQDALRAKGSLKDSFLQHSVGQEFDDDGNQQISYLFPDAQAVDKVPGFVDRDQSWVTVVMNGVHHTPFARVKSVFADITADDARAKGYIKGKQKIEEIFPLIKRVTTPITVYKLQKIDRDDIIDIVDFDAVAWIKQEMRGKLDEEIARAILVGDGRAVSSEQKIKEENIRPIWTDDDFYTIKQDVTAGSDDEETAKNFVKAAVKGRINYKGSGNPTLFTTEEWLTNALLAEDTIGHRLYKTNDELAAAMRVSKIVTSESLMNLTREVTVNGVAVTKQLMGIIVNLNDYNVGADKGGAVSLFDDFDIDFNKYAYLIETRLSGALIKPYSAIALEMTVPSGSGSTEAAG